MANSWRASRAAVIDKDRTPHWPPARIEDLPQAGSPRCWRRSASTSWVRLRRQQAGRNGHEDRFHRARQHGRADGGQSGQGGPCGERLRRRRASTVEGVAPAASLAEAVTRHGGGGHHAAERRDRARRPCRRSCRGAEAGALLIDCSTIDVDSARAVHEHGGARPGLLSLDAPVSGGTGGAAAGTLTFMVGGSEEAFEKGRPLFDDHGQEGGPLRRAGAGQAAKICNNMILGISMIGVCEAFHLADKLGLDRQAMFDVASTSSGSCWSINTYCPAPGIGPKSPADNDYKPGFAADLMLKDLNLSQTAAETAGATHRTRPPRPRHLRRLRRGRRRQGARLLGDPGKARPGLTAAVDSVGRRRAAAGHGRRHRPRPPRGRPRRRRSQTWLSICNTPETGSCISVRWRNRAALRSRGLHGADSGS